MENIYKLKTQLEEAIRFANSSVLGHDRIAVILMDNFVELQLGRQMLFKFRFEFLNGYKDLKYPLDKRKEILLNHDKLLKACHQEGLITVHEKLMITFSHEIRNRLYHRGDDDSQLIKIALHILHDIIVQRQPDWGGGTDIIGVPMYADLEHPFSKQRRTELGTHAYEIGSKEDWADFVKFKFAILDNDESPSHLLADYLVTGVKRLKSAMHFAITENEKKWSFNEFLQYYSFKVKYRDHLQRIFEMQNSKEAKIQEDELYKEYKQFYRPLSINRIKSFEIAAEQLLKLSTGEALDKYYSIRTDYYLIHDSFILAAREREQEIYDMIDKHKESLKAKKGGNQ